MPDMLPLVCAGATKRGAREVAPRAPRDKGRLAQELPCAILMLACLACVGAAIFFRTLRARYGVSSRTLRTAPTPPAFRPRRPRLALVVNNSK